MRWTGRIVATAGLLLLACDSTPAEVTRDLAVVTATATTAAPAASVSAAPAVAKPATASGETWNAAQIDWVPMKTALAHSKADHKPTMLVVYTTWCPHCKNYSHVFDDPRIVEKSRQFEMVRIDSDAEPELAAKYAVDGGYIPRTYFLGADGSVDTNVRASSARFQHFFDEHDPDSTLVAMARSVADFTK